VFAALIALALAAPSYVSAQTGAITGTVTNKATNTPIAGAQVQVAGTRYGAPTDENGRFSIPNVPAGSYALFVTYLGFGEVRQQNVEVTAGQPVNLTLQMEQTVLPLQELIASGVSDPTSGVKLPITVSRVGSEQLQVSTGGSPLQMIAGKVAGAYIARTSGRPGADVEIQLRSPTAFETSSRPLFVIDGVIVATDNMGNENNTGTLGMFTASPLADIDPSEIENIEVIKGAAAASLYGSRAAAGVVSITTNRGRDLQRGTTRITSRMEFGQSMLLGEQPITSSHHYLMNEAGTSLQNSAGRDTTWAGRTARPCPTGAATVACGRIMDLPYPGQTFDNLNALYNPGQYLTNTVTFSQTAENTTLLISLSRRNDAGALEGNDGRQQYNGRLSIDHRLGDKLSISLTGSHGRTRDDGESGNPYTSILTYPVYVDLTRKDADGKYLQLPDSTVEIENPLWRQTSRDNYSLRARTQGSLNARYNITRAVTADAQLSYDRSDSKAQTYVPKGVQTSVTSDQPSVGALEYEYQENNALNGSMGLTLLRQFGDLNARLTTRGTFEKEWRETFSVEGEDFVVKDTRDLSVTRSANDWASSTADVRANGMLADLGLDFRDRYIASFVVRRDGSSLFGPQEKWHTYKRVAAKYRISEESFFNIGWIDELGIRYAMGEAGGRPCSTCQYELWNVSRTSGLTRETAGNPQLRPSFTREQEVGIDMIAFNNKVQLELVYANQVSSDQIIIVPATVATGYSSVRANAGVLTGHTLEATLQYNAIRNQNLQWTISATADKTDTRLTEWERSCFFGSNTSREHEYTCAGQRMGDFWIHKFTATTAELPSWLQGRADEFTINDDGYLVWVGRNAAGEVADWRDGLKEECYSSATCGWGKPLTANGFTYRWGEPFLIRDEEGVLSRLNLGSSLPDLNFGFAHNVRFRDVTVYAAFRGQLGGKIYNRNRNWAYANLRHGDLDQQGKPDELKKPIDYYQRALSNNDTCNSRTGCGSFYDEFLEDATFLKMGELSVRYRLRRATLQKVMGRYAPADLALGFSANELFTLTGYTGWDPESGTPLSRQEAVTYPLLRTFRLTADITF
jgi:TonB-linked SusC/RagA family outer membrane protein